MSRHYSDERAEAFRAYMCLYGYKAAIDRCDWVAARRWFSEKEGERSRATARWALHCVAFATAYMVLHISMPQLVEEVPRPASQRDGLGCADIGVCGSAGIGAVQGGDLRRYAPVDSR